MFCIDETQNPKYQILNNYKFQNYDAQNKKKIPLESRVLNCELRGRLKFETLNLVLI